MLTTHQVLDLVRSDAARIERFTQRREVFLDALDWTMLTCEQVHEAAMLDFMLEDDLAEALQRLSMAESLAAMGLPLAAESIRYIPYPRPWHPEWATLAN
ncbi:MULTISPECIES: hypothetical protein [Novosphingobium]|uniref:hypothetical protein n=1 Tax=Novosphingobium TaxID=165696 RepID=UPI0022F29A98|nr:hypothetical protein [Novosphingobium resinovorum]GLK44529.1 hypothetical protein GCM10017612_24490 [Novosphingobium resinovorum]